MAVKNRVKYGRRAGGNKRTEKQILLARHKQTRKAIARRLGLSVSELEWRNNILHLVATGKPVANYIGSLLRPKPKVIASL